MLHKKCNKIIKELRLDLFKAVNIGIDKSECENKSMIHLVTQLNKAQIAYNELSNKYDSMRRKNTLEVANLYLKIDDLNKLVKRLDKG